MLLPPPARPSYSSPILSYLVFEIGRNPGVGPWRIAALKKKTSPSRYMLDFLPRALRGSALPPVFTGTTGLEPRYGRSRGRASETTTWSFAVASHLRHRGLQNITRSDPLQPRFRLAPPRPTPSRNDVIDAAVLRGEHLSSPPYRQSVARLGGMEYNRSRNNIEGARALKLKILRRSPANTPPSYADNKPLRFSAHHPIPIKYVVPEIPESSPTLMRASACYISANVPSFPAANALSSLNQNPALTRS
nr:hypothetical protein Iba_chr02bCG17110 [Ipomoea batatas]